MDLELTGKVAIVTGGARGIGAATVSLLRQEGCRVSAWDLTFDPNADLENEFIGEQRLVDVTEFDSVDQAWQRVEQQFGAVDILVHAAAIGSGSFGFPFTNVPRTAWDNVLKVNIQGMTNVAYVAGPAMSLRRTGVMVFLASVAGQTGSQTDPPYSATKAANINFAQCLAKDLAPFGVRVNTVCPGMVRTSLNESVWRAWNEQQPPSEQKLYHEWAEEKIAKVVPLARWQTPGDIASMIVFLCSQRASEVTGQTINVDGGCVMHC